MTMDNRINYINIGLMLISCMAAFIMPFEVFLFAYAFMGPLHYLTEISWLHDKNYYTKGKYDYWILVGIGVFISLEYLTYKFGLWPFNSEENKEMAQGWNLGDKLLFLAFFGALIMAFVKNLYVKLVCLFLIFLISNGVFMPNEDGEKSDSNLLYIFSSFVPTLIHVYVFTGLFMLFGALKARSKSGIWSVVVFVICPILLIALFRDQTFINVTQYGMKAYGNHTSSDGFFDLNQSILYRYFNPQDILKTVPGIDVSKDSEATLWNALIYKSQAGILLMRFIAFAYMYHYLNWFSKTEIIRWHKVPKIRFVAVIALWVASVVLYVIDYSLGLRWLFFLSFTHVLLEFPLNFVSFVGIFKEGSAIAKNGFSKPATVKASK
jgi:hypothetical protein